MTHTKLLQEKDQEMHLCVLGFGAKGGNWKAENEIAEDACKCARVSMCMCMYVYFGYSQRVQRRRTRGLGISGSSYGFLLSYFLFWGSIFKWWYTWG